MTMLPLDAREGWIWMDGAFVPWKNATMHVLTHGLHYASSVFEGERAYGGKIFRSVQHSQRLHASANMLGFSLPYTVDELEKAKADVIAKNNTPDGYVRAFAWRGSEALGIAAPKNTIHVAIASWEWPSYYNAEMKTKGIKLKTGQWRRPAPNTAPSAAKAAGLYMICTLSKHWAEKQGCQDALMLDYRGYLAEATSANLFLVIDGQLHTPTPDCILNGITRQTVMELARAQGMAVVERHMEPAELARASEVFLTGTAVEITPVGQIDDRTYTPAAITAMLSEAYAKAVRGQ
ncbi:MAG: branched-chain amino acid aminotransferase [Alphaproteobacteria bacterium]|nr:branched-chain amino acid aminotransferase [Alphaproteobacteria bacterium]NDG04336.1 branched-chain amino acid aminotransferase [Alphaproteobacteria bacterium]